jgi:hypothetical protein
MKDRYERDYLDAHKEALVLKGEMEALRNGEGAGGDGKEANVALRMRLNECVEEGEDVKKRLAELVVSSLSCVLSSEAKPSRKGSRLILSVLAPPRSSTLPYLRS